MYKGSNEASFGKKPSGSFNAMQICWHMTLNSSKLYEDRGVVEVNLIILRVLHVNHFSKFVYIVCISEVFPEPRFPYIKIGLCLTFVVFCTICFTRSKISELEKSTLISS